VPTGFLDAPPLASSRVTLRRLAASDLRAFQSYRGNPDVGKYQGWSPMTDAEAGVFLEHMAAALPFVPGAWFQFGIADRNSGVLIGDIGVCIAPDGGHAEIGFTLQPASQGRGLGSEAVRAVVDLLLDRVKVPRVVAITDARNLPSVRLLERVGMRRVETTSTSFRGEPCVEHRFAVSRQDGG
jgi:RimJ/RimL family protein N-acetyltransferase